MIALINNQAKEVKICSFIRVSNQKEYISDGGKNSIWIQKNNPMSHLKLSEVEIATSRKYTINKIEVDGDFYEIGQKININGGIEREIFGFSYDNGLSISGIDWSQIYFDKNNSSNVLLDSDNIDIFKIEIDSCFLVKKHGGFQISELKLLKRTPRGYIKIENVESGVRSWQSIQDFLELYEIIDVC